MANGRQLAAVPDAPAQRAERGCMRRMVSYVTTNVNIKSIGPMEQKGIEHLDRVQFRLRAAITQRAIP